MILGISGCTALLVTGYGVKDSVTNIADMQYDEIQITLSPTLIPIFSAIFAVRTAPPAAGYGIGSPLCV